MPLYYLDASALVKLVVDEPESGPLRAYLLAADRISCELVRAEVPRAVRRAVGRGPMPPLELLLGRSLDVLDGLAMLPLDAMLLDAAGAIGEPGLRALDAIHVAAAAQLDSLDAFVTYDHRQGAAARLVGLRTTAPG